MAFGDNKNSAFSTIGDVGIKDETLYFTEPGKYILALDKVVYGHGDSDGQRPGDPYCAWEFLVVDRLSESGKPKGMVVSKADYLTGKGKKYKLRDIRAMMASFLHKSQEEISQQVADNFVEDDGAMVDQLWEENFGCKPLIFMEIKKSVKDSGDVYHDVYPRPATEEQIRKYVDQVSQG